MAFSASLKNLVSGSDVDLAFCWFSEIFNFLELVSVFLVNPTHPLRNHARTHAWGGDLYASKV